MSLRLPLWGDKFAIIFTIYAGPILRYNEAENKFYEDLHALLTTVPKAEKLIVLGEFNTSLGMSRGEGRDKQDMPMITAIPSANGRIGHRLVHSKMRLVYSHTGNLKASDHQGLLLESRFGFHRNRGTIDMIRTARHLQDKSQEIWIHLYSSFADLMKDFDSVNRGGLWKLMQKLDCPEQLTHMVRKLNNGMMAYITEKGAVSETFTVTNGVKQSCLLLPTLCRIYLTAKCSSFG
ncbi:unnamed protein product [Schistocephalus solidus]|uniref:Reverse transcriptase domain-containing protein n=1 Tax=Schistocephalus solidus TaxID=70667 RepID=A0A183S7B2_SCHSO|nr:unnamed protein product [Schistocephalus solidus]